MSVCWAVVVLGKTADPEKADEATKSAAESRKKQLEEMSQAILASPCIHCFHVLQSLW